MMTQMEARQRVMHILLDIGFEAAQDLAAGKIKPGEGEGKVIAAMTELMADVINCLPENKASEFSRWKTYDCLTIRNEKDEAIDAVRAIEEHNGLIDKLEREHGKPQH